MNTKTTVTTTQARKEIFKITDDVQKHGRYYTLTENGLPKAVLMSAGEYESLMETLDVLSDPKAVADIEQAKAELDRGEYVTLDELRNELNIPAPGFAVAEKRAKYSKKPANPKKTKKK